MTDDLAVVWMLSLVESNNLISTEKGKRTMPKVKYISIISRAESMDDLNFILEIACQDEDLTNAEYCSIYDTATTKAYEFTPYVNCSL